MPLDDRKSRILQAIVDEYVATADPVGSEALVSRYVLGCRSATLRNEMSEMADLGYLVQPHTSAGRIPSDTGYRYYVDCLMPSPPAADPAATRRLSTLARRLAEIEAIVQETCRLLAEMTSYPSVATSPALNEVTLQRLHLALAARSHVLVVLIFSNGHVENRVLDAGFIPDPRSLLRTGTFIERLLVGSTFESLARRTAREVPAELYGDEPLIRLVLRAINDCARNQGDGKLFLEGTSHILREREFHDVGRLEQLLATLEKRSLLLSAMSRSGDDDRVTVTIGAESPVPAMQECSMVSSHYKIGDSVGGFIGVLGPTRMRYNQAMGAVGLAASALTSVLSSHSLA